MNIKILKAALTRLFFSVSGFANAGIITLDFEGVDDYANINDLYNGGTDSLANSSTNYGISFGSSTLGCVDSDAGGSCNFANEPTANTVMFFLSGSHSILNNAAGFDTGFSFYYSSSTAVSVNVYSSLNLTGSLLGSITLSANYTDNGCAGDPNGLFCNWDRLIRFCMAHSIDFGGTADQVGFDNITFGSVNSNQVPEPSIFALAVIG